MSRVASISTVLIFVLGGGCVSPEPQVRTVDSRPLLCFEGISVRATIFLDGLEIGSADQFEDGNSCLRVLPGTHNVEIREGTEVIFRERLYLGAGSTQTVEL